LLRPESVDPDLLEEQARARLGLTQGDEVVILKDKR
jgi:cell division protein FtsB